MAQTIKNLPAMWEIRVRSLDWEHLLEKGMAIHSSILAWRIPRTEEPVGYSPWGCKESDTLREFHSLILCLARKDARVSILIWQFSPFTFESMGSGL